MLVLVKIPPSTPGDTVRACLYLLEALILLDMDILRSHRWIPPLYRSGLRFRGEPPGQEQFDNPLVCLERGWLDCDDAVGWRAAELRLARGRALGLSTDDSTELTAELRRRGELATARIIWPEGQRRYHARVRREDGTEEDPCVTLRRTERQGRRLPV